VEGKVGKGIFLKIYPVQGIVREGFRRDIGDWKSRKNRLYSIDIEKSIRKSSDNKQVSKKCKKADEQTDTILTI
jgi:hypothetical protein